MRASSSPNQTPIEARASAVPFASHPPSQYTHCVGWPASPAVVCAAEESSLGFFGTAPKARCSGAMRLFLLGGAGLLTSIPVSHRSASARVPNLRCCAPVKPFTAAYVSAHVEKTPVFRPRRTA